MIPILVIGAGVWLAPDAWYESLGGCRTADAAGGNAARQPPQGCNEAGWGDWRRNLIRYEALTAAAIYLEQQLTEAGYKVERNDFEVSTPIGPRSTSNLIAELKGAQKPSEIVIIGAHYDSREGTPGADDNASGTASALSLARTFVHATPDRTLRFVFFTNEEYFRQDLMGSLVYAKPCRARGDNIVAMVSLETIGYFSDVADSQKYPFPINLFYPSTGNFLGFVGNIDLALSRISNFAGDVWRIQRLLLFRAHGDAVLGATELAHFGRPWVTGLAVLIVVFEVATVLVLRAHYTMDVFTGAIAALYVASVVRRRASIMTPVR